MKLDGAAEGCPGHDRLVECLGFRQLVEPGLQSPSRHRTRHLDEGSHLVEVEGRATGETRLVGEGGADRTHDVLWWSTKQDDGGALYGTARTCSGSCQTGPTPDEASRGRRATGRSGQGDEDRQQPLPDTHWCEGLADDGAER